MSIFGDLQKFGLDSLITLYVLDLTSKGDGLFYFHAGTNQASGNIVWQGQTYIAIPCEADGFEMSGTSFPRPKFRVANINGVFSTMVTQLGDLVGCKVTRKRTTARYLDAVNFTSGNPTANPNEHFPDDIFYIVRKTAENKLTIEFELGSALDLQGVMLPRRQIIASVCPFVYRSEECGYTGGPVATKDDLPTDDASQDVCSKRVVGCKKRFGENGELRYGGFAGAGLIDI